MFLELMMNFICQVSKRIIGLLNERARDFNIVLEDVSLVRCDAENLCF